MRQYCVYANDKLVDIAVDLALNAYDVLIVDVTRDEARRLKEAADGVLYHEYHNEIWYSGLGGSLPGRSFNVILATVAADAQMDRDWYESTLLTRLRPAQSSQR